MCIFNTEQQTLIAQSKFPKYSEKHKRVKTKLQLL